MTDSDASKVEFDQLAIKYARTGDAKAAIKAQGLETRLDEPKEQVEKSLSDFAREGALPLSDFLSGHCKIGELTDPDANLCAVFLFQTAYPLVPCLLVPFLLLSFFFFSFFFFPFFFFSFFFVFVVTCRSLGSQQFVFTRRFVLYFVHLSIPLRSDLAR